MGMFLEEVGLELGPLVVELGIWELLRSNRLILVLWVSHQHADSKQFLMIRLGEP